MVLEEIDFEISRSDLLLRLCDDWCSHQNFSLTFDSTRLRLGLQIGIIGIIAQGSDFPDMTLQNFLLFLDKLAELISQKLLHLEKQLFTVISNLKLI
jgi:hypothetical protein